MKLTTLTVFCFFCFSVTTYAQKVSCESYLQPTTSTSLTVIPDKSTAVTISKSNIKIDPIKTKIRSAMIKHELIFSDFFYSFFNKKTVDYKNEIYSGYSSNQIALMSVDETYAVALDVYQKMKSAFINPTTYDLRLKSPADSKDLFFSIPEDIAVHFIHESIMSYGIDGSYSDFAVKYADQKMGVVLGPVSGIGLSSLGLYFLGIDNFILSSELLSTIGFTGTGLAAALMAAGSKIHAKIKKTKLNSSLHKVERRKLAENQTRMMLKKSHGHKLSEDLNRIEIALDRLNFDESQPLLTYGSEILGLHRDLIQSFVADFSRWMNVYGQNGDLIKNKLKELRQGQTKNSNNSGFMDSSVISFTGQVFVEAANATNKSTSTGEHVLKKLKEALGVLNQMETSRLSQTQLLDFSRKSETLRNAITIQVHFLDYLTNVYKTISQILESVDRLTVAESGAMVKAISDRLSQDMDLNSNLDQLLKDLDRIETYFEDISLPSN